MCFTVWKKFSNNAQALWNLWWSHTNLNVACGSSVIAPKTKAATHKESETHIKSNKGCDFPSFGKHVRCKEQGPDSSLCRNESHSTVPKTTMVWITWSGWLMLSKFDWKKFSNNTKGTVILKFVRHHVCQHQQQQQQQQDFCRKSFEIAVVHPWWVSCFPAGRTSPSIHATGYMGPQSLPVPFLASPAAQSMEHNLSHTGSPVRPTSTVNFSLFQAEHK